MIQELMYKANPSQPYTLPSRSKSPPHDQNLSKSMATPAHGLKYCSKIERKMTEKKTASW